MSKLPRRKELDEKTQKNMLTRTITGIVLALIAIPAVIVGHSIFVFLLAVALIIATHEFINARQGRNFSVLLQIFIYTMIFSFVFWVYIRNNIEANIRNGFDSLDFCEWSFAIGFSDIVISTMGVAVLIFILFAVTIFRENVNMSDISYLFMMVMFIGISFQSFLFLRFFPYTTFRSFNEVFGTPLMHGATALTDNNYLQGSLLIIYIVIGTIFNDIGAYFVGVFFGKTKLNPRISPNKTWEGFWGGVLISFIVSFVFGITVAALNYPILPWMTVDGWYWILILSVFMPFMANLGDFSFSMIKREYNIKDYGTILKGMGGLLDRIDSLLAVGFGMAILIILISNIMLTGNPFAIHRPEGLVGLLL